MRGRGGVHVILLQLAQNVGIHGSISHANARKKHALIIKHIGKI